MTEYLHLADVRILLWLNHSLAQHPMLYRSALWLTDTGGDVAVLLTAAALWLWPWDRRQLGITELRRESRARLLTFGAAGIAAYVTARLIALGFDAPRPFATFLPVRGPVGVFEGLRTFGTFPSDHAALLGALPPAIARWSSPLGAVWLVTALVLIVVRVAVGFHYPWDMLAGALIGAAFSLAAMAIFDRHGAVYYYANRVAAGFSRKPTAYFLYAGLALIGIEFAMHFSHVLWLVLALRSLVAS